MSAPSPLAPDALAAAMRSLPHWQVRDGGRAIGRSWRFPDFAAAFAWVGRIAAVAEALDHHPDIAFGWGRVSVCCTTAETGALTMRDIRLAAAINALEG